MQSKFVARTTFVVQTKILYTKERWNKHISNAIHLPPKVIKTFYKAVNRFCLINLISNVKFKSNQIELIEIRRVFLSKPNSAAKFDSISWIVIFSSKVIN